MKNILLITILLVSSIASAQNLSHYSDHNFRDEVETVLLHPAKYELDKPVIFIDDMKEQLLLQFDILADEAPYLYYTFIHCNNQWQPSDIQKNDYINGFFQDEIDNYTFSLNTMISYVHYELLFPTEEMMPKLSGNYLLVVTGEDPDDIYFTRRFYIVEGTANISVTILRYPSNLQLGANKQQIELEISYPNMFNTRADQYSNVTIQQNGRWDNAVFGIKPSFVYPEKLSYINNDNMVFESGNQFLRINTSNFDNRPEKTRTVYREEEYYEVTLYNDTKRNTHTFIEDEDLFGEKYIYLEKTYLDPTKEADYALVNFFLEWPEYMIGKDIYIIGAITDWRIDDKAKMEYDTQRKGYKKSLLLKQGYYDYMYAVRDKASGKVSLTPINGDFWETTNKYTIFVYLFNPTLNYDQLIGYTTINSH
ncbi:MAG: type IX secretion system plug protein domain-containing protein [Candidatus Limimorpha sp.]